MTTNTRTIALQAGMGHLAYGMALKDKKDFNSPLAFDDYDLWFGNDFNFLLDEIMDGLLLDIESDITSVDSTNLSEAHSAQESAQSSANRAAMKRAGLISSDETSDPTADEISRVSSLSSDLSGNSVSSGSSSDSDLEETPTVDHTHGHHKDGYHHTTESSYSGRSHTDTSDSGFSHSSGTSNATGEASTLSSVSFTVKEYENIYENNVKEQEIRLFDADERRRETEFTDEEYEDIIAQNRFKAANVGGIEWIGDADNEVIQGSAWLDDLFGSAGDDKIYGFEGADFIVGGDGVDQLFGGGGDDVIITRATGADRGSETVGNGDFASGGSGNDTI
jgi:Ca2+-binding RTX toxin-like protein